MTDEIDVTEPDKSYNRKLIPLTQWSQHHSYPPLGGLRHLVFNAESNGFDKCIRRVGKRILIDEQAYFAWVDEQNMLNPA